MQTISKKFPGSEISLTNLFRTEDFGIFLDWHVYVKIIWHKTTIEIPCAKNLSESINCTLNDEMCTEEAWIGAIQKYPLFENSLTGYWIRFPKRIEEELKEVGRDHLTDDDYFNWRAYY
jgi:hypothetical protein